MKYQIFIKGKANGLQASCGVVVLKEGELIMSNGKLFREYISTKKEKIPLIEYKAQFQMELYALAWGLTYCAFDSEIEVYSNNLAIVGWINKWEVSEEYEPVFDYCKHWVERKTIHATHVRKGTNEYIDQADMEATFYTPDILWKEH